MSTLERMPALVVAEVRWDANARRVRYFAKIDAIDEWLEISSDEFANVTRASVQDSIASICVQIDETLESVKDALDELLTFGKSMEKTFNKRSEPTEN